MRRKLILFTSAFPYGKGEQFLEDEIYFLNKFFNVEIIPFSYGGKKEKRNIPQSIFVHKPLTNNTMNFKILSKVIFSSFEELRKIKFNIKKFRLYLSAVRSASSVLSNTYLINYLKSLPTDSIIYFYWGHASAFALPFLENIEAKIIMRLHRGDLYEYLHNNYYPLRKKQFVKVDKVLPISNNGKEYLLKKYPFLKDKIEVHKLGVINDNYITSASKDDIIRIVSVSSVSPVKRVQLIPQILKNIHNKKIIWTHFGDGPLMDKLQNEVKNLPNNITVILKGHRSRKDILNFYRNNPVDIFINISLNEGIPVSIMEAISFGIPIIATSVGGTPEVVNKDTGVLIEKDFRIKEVSKLIENLDMLKFNRLKVKEFWKNNYDAKKNYKKFIEFLRKL